MVNIHDVAPNEPRKPPFKKHPLNHRTKTLNRPKTAEAPAAVHRLQPKDKQTTATEQRDVPRPDTSPPIRTPTKSAQIGKQNRLKISYLLTVVIAVALGLLIQHQLVGQILILLYAIVSFIWRIPSRTAFTLALLSLGAMFMVLAFDTWTIAENFAAYSFLLFSVGAVSVCIEQWHVSRLLRKKHQTTS